MQKKHKKHRFLSMLLAVATTLSLAAFPVSAAEVAPAPDKSLGDASTSVTISKGTNLHVLSKSTGGTIGGSAWTYTSNDNITGPAYCVNWGLGMVSPTKRLQITGRYDRNPQTMGAFANGYPQRTLEQFKSLHPEIQGIANLTTDEYAYATQLAIWATCGQLSVPGTNFSSGRAALVKPTSDAQQIRVYESVVAILKLAQGWTKQLYTGLYFHMEKNSLGNTLTVNDEDGLAGAAQKGVAGIRKETINGKEYYTRLMYVDSATSTYPNDYMILVYSMDAPAGTIFVDASNQALTSRQQWGATMYEVPTPKPESTSLNSNGSAYTGAFKICLPVDNVTDSGSFKVNAYAVITQFNLYLAYNPDASEQSYIIADPNYVGKFTEANIQWTTSDIILETASLQIQKVDGGAMPLEGAEFKLVGSKGTVKTGISDGTGLVTWTDLPVNESYVLSETKAPKGFSIVAPRNITLTAGQTAFVTVQDDTEHHFTIKKIDAQNGSALQGAVFRFEQIDGTYVTTGTTGFDGMLEFAGDDLPYGSYRVSEERSATGYEKDTSIQTVKWDGTKDVLLTFQNVRQPTIVVSKVDGVTGISLPGAIFDIYKDGEKIGSATTDDAGEIRFPIVSGEGYFEFEERVAPEGYQLDRTRHGIYVDPYDPQTKDDPVLVIENYNNPSLRIIKYDQKSGNRLSGVTFEIYKDGVLFDTKTTNGSGEISLYNLEPGTYLAKEIAADHSHVVNSTPQQIELKAGQQETQTLVFFNQLKPGIHLIKVDSQTLKSIPNVRFEIKQVGGSYRQEFLTDLNGEIDLSALEPSAYEVRELAGPEGYLIDDGVRIIQLNPDEDASFVFTNTRKPSLVIVKYDPNTGKYLAGATFRISYIEDGTRYLDRVTGTDGRIVLEGMEPGVLSVQELEAPAGYVKNDTEYHVELFPGRESQLVVNNEAKPDLKIVKTDAVSGEPVAGVTFTIKMADGRTITTEATDANGEIFLEDMEPGVVEIWEQSVPDNYLISDKHELITLVPNKLGTVRFQNYPKPGLLVQKVDSVTDDPLEGVKFHVVYASNNTFTGEINDLGYYYTDEKGQFWLDKLQDGWFKVTEEAPKTGYAIKDPAAQECYIKAGTTKTLVFENTPLSALVVYKYDSVTGAAVEGAVFQVKYLGGTSGTGGTVIGTYKTSANGSFTLTSLKTGSYVVEELASDSNHVIDTAPQTAYISGKEQDVVQLYFGNAPKGSLTVKKIDAASHAPLSDVEFTVVKSDGSYVGSANGKFVTDSSGSFTIEGIDPGTTLVVKESRAKDGYLLDDTAQTITVKAGQAAVLEFRNQPKGSLVILKKDSVTGRPLEGVEFEIRYSDGRVVDTEGGKLSSNGIYKTDKNGKITITQISGTLVVTEVQTLPNYIIDPNTRTQTVVVNPNDTQTLTFYNTPKTTLYIYKYIEGTKNEPLAGVTFQITDSSGKVLGPNNGQYVSDKNGRIVVTGLTPGTTVKVQEVKTVSGFLLDGQPQSILIKEGAVQSLTFWNRPIGGIEIIKVNAADKSERIPNVTFEIRRTDDALIDTITTDKQGRAYLELEDGAYYALEVDCPGDFKLDATPIYFTVKDGRAVSKTVTNEPLGGIIIHKTDSTTGEGIYGVKFVLYDSAGTPLKEVTTDQNGYVYLRGLAVDREQKFLLRELEAAPGYELDKEYKTVYLAAGQTKTIEWKNTPITGQIQIYKYAAEANPITGAPAGTPLQGAVYEISEARSGRVVDYITTDARGVAASKPLPLNRYKIREVTAPAYWQVDATVFDETLEYPGQIIKLSAYDKPAKLGVTITKRGNAEVLAGSQMRYDITVANTSNVPLESFFWHDRIPTDAARATALTTGTYSARLTYRILYKTNYTSNYQVLASNLLTSNNYSFALNAIPMQAGEVITDVYFDFGTVPVGFQSVTGPTLSVQVLTTVANGYQLVNRADVGGKYQGTWQTAQANWVTIIRKYTTTPTLPKTGY